MVFYLIFINKFEYEVIIFFVFYFLYVLGESSYFWRFEQDEMVELGLKYVVYWIEQLKDGVVYSVRSFFLF